MDELARRITAFVKYRMVKSRGWRLFFNLSLGLAALLIFIIRFGLPSASERREVGNDGSVEYSLQYSTLYPSDYEAASDFKAMGDFAEAEKIYQKLAEKEPDSPDPFIGLASCRVKTGDHEGAQAFYRKALEVDPECVCAVVGLGSCYLGLRDYASAARTYREALVIDRECPEAHWGLVMAYSHLKVKAKAFYHLERFRELAPDSKYIGYLEDLVNQSFPGGMPEEIETER